MSEMLPEMLLPCPFCGGEANLMSDYSSEHDHTFWQVWHDCSTNPGPIRHTYGHALGMEISTPWCASEDAAVALWNRRAERTCHMVHDHLTDTVFCDVCGERFDSVAQYMAMVPETFSVTEYKPEYKDARYCPHCGARVVDES